jgi:hypothetical protein
MSSVRRIFTMAGITAFVLLVRAGQAAEPARAEADFFEQKIRPVLVEHCFACHSARAPKLKGGLRLDTREGVRQGGESGPAIVPGKPDASLMLRALRYTEHKMPPRGQLPERVIADFQRWIETGAIDPRTDASATAGPIDVEAGKRFWSFQPPRAHVGPGVRDTAWPRKKVDRFILARLEEANLAPTPPAKRQTWLRRVSFDLIGLPPTPEEIDAFVADDSADAHEKVVERLLASPHYGERWARPWLDLARFAEDQAHIVGSDESLFYPNAFLYRDWVIAAFNEDVPYDRFLRLQLAADLLEPGNDSQQAALGFLGLGPKYFGRKDPEVIADEWEDRIDTVCRGLLGLTAACARCHDHKFDPIPTEDYYALAGVFAGTRMFNRPLHAKIGKDASGEANDPLDAVHVVREGTPTDLHVFVRGDRNNPGPLVQRHFLQALSPGPPAPFVNGSGRRELAEAIARRDNPLTARVFVNRIWALHFGRPLVGTPSNFGALGERPTHSELLDDLAVRFMDSGWSLKWLHRELVLSAAYGQSSTSNPQQRSVDPDNRLLGRMNRRRLSVEAWRDALLACAGQLDRAIGGRSINPLDPAKRRRTIYCEVSRLDLNRMLALFDFPDPNAHADRRFETTTPLQKLFVLNSPWMVAQAAGLAERLLHKDATDRMRIERAYRLLYGRPASARELQLGLDYLGSDGDRLARWGEYAHALLAANEMMFVD